MDSQRKQYLDNVINKIGSLSELKPERIIIFCDNLNESERKYVAGSILSRAGCNASVLTFPGRPEEGRRYDGHYVIDLAYFLGENKLLMRTNQ